MKRRVLWVSLAIFLLGLTVRLAIAARRGGNWREPDYEAYKMARSLARHGTLADPYCLPTGASAHSTPAYPVILAMVLRTASPPAQEARAHVLLNVFLASAAWALLPWVAWAGALPLYAGVGAGAFGALLPINLWTETQRGEPALIAILLMLVSIETLLRWRGGRLGLWPGVVQGILWALTLLAAPSPAPALLLLFIGDVVRFRRRRELGPHVGAMTLTLALALVPWALRNSRALGSPVVFRSNFGLELRVSNNDYAHVSLDDNVAGSAYRVYHPSMSEERAAEVRRLGEAEFNRLARAEAVAWIASHKQAFARLTVCRVATFWFPTTAGRPVLAVLAMLTLAGFYGFSIALRQYRPLAWVIGAIWLGYPLTYYVLQSAVRYRYAIHWTFPLLGAVALAHVAAHLRSRQALSRGLPDA